MMIILSAVDMVMSPRLIYNDNEKMIKDIEEIKKRELKSRLDPCKSSIKFDTYHLLHL